MSTLEGCSVPSGYSNNKRYLRSRTSRSVSVTYIPKVHRFYSVVNLLQQFRYVRGQNKRAKTAVWSVSVSCINKEHRFYSQLSSYFNNSVV